MRFSSNNPFKNKALQNPTLFVKPHPFMIELFTLVSTFG